uniref:Uncharacterized conserved protein, contains HEPN domain n=1 Tax=Candidatus Kentrum sp. LFY TaxID=2126342 RepID=A0A450UGJ9_9GAMM|nr:MAG: Uncharacterized conserved protein, contains HEPN domain [Candidatus Kentron sp. LFY]
MPKREDGAVIRDMREAMDRIASYLSGMDYDDFLLDYRTQDAVIRNIEILGEAAKLLSDEAKSRYPDMPWRDIAGTRDRLIHNYFGVNIDIVWDIATNQVPLCQRQLK